MYNIIGYKKYSDIEIIEKDGRLYALDGWNGEAFYNTWQCNKTGEPINDENLTAKPIYQFNNDDAVIIDYNIE